MSASVKVKINVNPQAKALIQNAANKGLNDRAIAVQREARRKSPAVKGHNRRSIDMASPIHPTEEGRELGLKDGQAAAYSTSGYGGYLEIGTGIYGPHKQPIRPVKARVLSWVQADGTRVFAREVKGRPATPYLHPAQNKEFTPEKLAKDISKHMGGMSHGTS